MSSSAGGVGLAVELSTPFAAHPQIISSSNPFLIFNPIYFKKRFVKLYDEAEHPDHRKPEWQHPSTVIMPFFAQREQQEGEITPDQG